MDAGDFRTLSKKERLSIQREIDKLNNRIGGLKTMTRLPNMIFIVDTVVEDLAVLEANKLKLPIIAMTDTNSNPDPIDYAIPSNDDAIRAVKLIVSVIADAAEEGIRIREVQMSDTGQVSRSDLAEMERYLGPSTLAKLKSKDEDLDLEVEGDEYEEFIPVADEEDIAVIDDIDAEDDIEIDAEAREEV
jgi:small subunit ribosomal protein S2